MILGLLRDLRVGLDLGAGGTVLPAVERVVELRPLNVERETDRLNLMGVVWLAVPPVFFDLCMRGDQAIIPQVDCSICPASSLSLR